MGSVHPGLATRSALAPQPQPPGLLEKSGYVALAFFVFIVFSSVVELIPGIAVVHPALLVAVVGLMVVGITGRGAALLKNKVGVCYTGLSLWFCIGLPFCLWPGGAFGVLTSEWLVAFLSFFMAGGLVWDTDRCGKIFRLIGYSGLILSLVALGQDLRDPLGRLTGSGRYANSNDLATVMLITLPFLGFVAFRNGNNLGRLVAAFGFVSIPMAVAGTESRGAEIGAAAAILTLFFNVGMAQKMKLMVGVAVTLLLAIALLPGQTVMRLTTFFGDDANFVQMDENTLSSIASANSRKMLFLDSITVTLDHPLLGVGQGNFMVAQNDLALARGEEKGDWHVTHNTYTQISSESGFPGLLMFLAAIIFSLRGLSRTVKVPFPPGSDAGQAIRAMVVTLRVSFAAFLACAIFASLAYLPILPILSGLAVSLEYCATKLSAELQANRPPPARSVQPVRSWQGTRPRQKFPLAPTAVQGMK